MENKKGMWIVVTENGVSFIGRDGKEAQKGKFWNWASNSLGYPPIFKQKSDALRFAKKIREQSVTAKTARIVEVEFYKGELNAR